VYIDTGSPVLYIPSKSRDLVDENNKVLTEWKWFEKIVLQGVSALTIYRKRNLIIVTLNSFREKHWYLYQWTVTTQLSKVSWQYSVYIDSKLYRNVFSKIPFFMLSLIINFPCGLYVYLFIYQLYLLTKLWYLLNVIYFFIFKL